MTGSNENETLADDLDPIGQVLLQCIRRPKNEWSLVLERACLAEPDLAVELRARFAQYVQLEQLLAAPSEPSTPRMERFRLLRLLGAGGMGVVWLAEQVGLERPVALKLIRPEYLESSAMRSRFAREALAASKLDHPAICPVYEVGEDGGQPYLAMRYLDGRTLAELIARRGAETSGSDRSLTALHSTLLQFEQLCEGLQFAHDRGLIHRDIKPANVMITARGEAVLLDFGLARDLGSEGSALTVTGNQIGTPAYMPPEQVRGQNRALDHRADIYSLGVTLFEALTGRRPFEDSDRERLFLKILQDDPPNPLRLRPGLPSELRPVLDKALEKDPSRRYARIADFGEQLRRIRSREPITVRPIGPALRIRRWTQRHPAATATIVLLCAGLASALVGIRTLLVQGRELAAESNRLRATALAHEAMSILQTAPSEALELALRAEALETSALTLGTLQAASRGQHELLRLSAPEVEQAIWSPVDPRVLASRNVEGKAFVWHVRDEDPERFELAGPPAGSRIECIAFSPDGVLVATTCNDGYVRVHRSSDGSLLWRSDVIGAAADEAPWWVEFRPGSDSEEFSIGVALASGGTHENPATDGSPRRVRWCLCGPQDEVRSSPRSVEVRESGLPPRCHFRSREELICCAQGAAFLWNLDDGSIGEVLEKRPPRGLNLFDIVPGGPLLLSFGTPNRATVHTTDGRSFAIEGHAPYLPVTAGAVSPDGSRVVTGGDDGQALLTRISQDAKGELNLLTTTLPGHGSRISDVGFAPDGRRILTATMSGVIRIFDSEGVLITRLDGHQSRVRSATFSADGTQVLSAGLDQTIRIWSIASLGLPILEHETEVLEAVFAPDGGTLVTTTLGGWLHLWSREGRAIRKPVFLPGADRLRFDPADPNRLAAAFGRRIAVLDLASGEREVVAELPRGDLRFHDLSWTRDGRLWALQRTNDGNRAQVRAFARTATDPWSESFCSPSLPRCHAFAPSPNGTEVLLGCYDGAARLLRVEGWTESTIFRHGEGMPLSMVGWSADGSRVFTLSKVADTTVKVWQHSGGASIDLLGHVRRPEAAAFSPDGQEIATCGPDGSVRTWRTRDGACLMTIPAEEGIVHGVDWSPDGGELLSASSDGRALILHARPDRLRATARRLVVAVR